MITKEELQQLADNKVTQKEIAKMYNTSQSMISQYYKKYGIKSSIVKTDLKDIELSVIIKHIKEHKRITKEDFVTFITEKKGCDRTNSYKLLKKLEKLNLVRLETENYFDSIINYLKEKIVTKRPNLVRFIMKNMHTSYGTAYRVIIKLEKNNVIEIKDNEIYFLNKIIEETWSVDFVVYNKNTIKQ